MVGIMLENREDNHLQNDKRVLNSFLDVIHIHQEMMSVREGYPERERKPKEEGG